MQPDLILSRDYAPKGLPPPQICGFAVASLVTAVLVFFPLGIVFGHVSMRRIRNSNGRLIGRGLAIAGMTIGYLLALVVMLLLAADS